MKISTIAGILGIIISLGTIGGVYVSLDSRVCVLEEQYDTKTETDDTTFSISNQTTVTLNIKYKFTQLMYAEI